MISFWKGGGGGERVVISFGKGGGGERVVISFGKGGRGEGRHIIREGGGGRGEGHHIIREELERICGEHVHFKLWNKGGYHGPRKYKHNGP